LGKNNYHPGRPLAGSPVFAPLVIAITLMVFSMLLMVIAIAFMVAIPFMIPVSVVIAIIIIAVAAMLPGIWSIRRDRCAVGRYGVINACQCERQNRRCKNLRNRAHFLGLQSATPDNLPSELCDGYTASG
jgi:hypothetical protein